MINLLKFVLECFVIYFIIFGVIIVLDVMLSGINVIFLVFCIINCDVMGLLWKFVFVIGVILLGIKKVLFII